MPGDVEALLGEGATCRRVVALHAILEGHARELAAAETVSRRLAFSGETMAIPTGDSFRQVLLVREGVVGEADFIVGQRTGESCRRAAAGGR